MITLAELDRMAAAVPKSWKPRTACLAFLLEFDPTGKPFRFLQTAMESHRFTGWAVEWLAGKWKQVSISPLTGTRAEHEWICQDPYDDERGYHYGSSPADACFRAVLSVLEAEAKR